LPYYSVFAADTLPYTVTLTSDSATLTFAANNKRETNVDPKRLHVLSCFETTKAIDDRYRQATPTQA